MNVIDRPAGEWVQHERSGVWLTDETGRQVIAGHCAGGVFNLGFNADDVRRDLIAIISEHDAGLWAFRSERRDEGERAYGALLPAPLARTYFVSCAAEAFEVACKLAKRITRRHGLVSVTGGYHGHVGFGLAMDDDAMGAAEFGPLAGGIRRAVYGSIDSLAELVDETTAAVCMETIQQPAGVIDPPEGYFAAVRRLCDARGALMILDEVQTGVCRTGRIWGIEHHDVVPDLMVAGKGISGGFYPVGALSYAERHHEHTRQPLLIHPSSYAGNEIGSRLVGTLARRYADPALCAHVTKVGNRLAEGLRAIARRHADTMLPDLRGRGLLLGTDVRDPERRDPLIGECLRAGLLVRGSRMHRHVVVFQPPLVITAAEVDEMLDRFETAVHAVSA